MEPGSSWIFNDGGYRFKALVENNLVYQNGGAGIMVYKSTNATISENTSWHNHLDTHSTKGIWRTELQTQASDNITWINNTAVADQTVSPYNAAIGSFSFTGDTNTGIVWRGNTTFDGQAGDPSFRTNGGNAGPSAALNKLGVNTGLDILDILALARSLGASGGSGVDSGGPQAPAPSTPTPSADVVGDNGGNTLYARPGNKVLEGLGGADVFHFAGAWVSGTKVDRILDLDFGERDAIVLRGYDPGTFASAPGLLVFDGGRAATVDSLADLRALVTKSADVTSRSGGGGTEVLRIAQDGSAHEIRLDGYDHLL